MEIPYTVDVRRDTGLYNAKVGIWLFLASEVMLFGALFSDRNPKKLNAPHSWKFPTQLMSAATPAFTTQRSASGFSWHPKSCCSARSSQIGTRKSLTHLIHGNSLHS